MSKYHLELSEAERALVERIDLRLKHPSHAEGRASYLSNQKPILALLKSLHDRSALPKSRIRYWKDPACNTGRLKGSNESLFQRYGTNGADIYTDPHFVPFLRYFLFGADLPPGVIEAFEEHVGNPEWVTSGDVVPMGKFARDLTRRFGLERNHASEEFFKLCLDMGLDLSIAQSVRRSVMQAK